MNKERDQLQEPTSPFVKPNDQDLKLQPYVELAKHITDSPVCEINLIESGNRWTVARDGDGVPCEESICNDTIRQEGIYEVEDLSNNARYKDHSYVNKSPYFRYYCGAKLTTSNGKDVGTICVLDTKSKRISNEQKEQLRHLARAVMNTIESESGYYRTSSKPDAQIDSIHKLKHDIRNPISGIARFADLLIEDKNSTEVRTRDIIMIKESAEAILNIIDGALDHIDTDNSKHKEIGETPLPDVIEKLKYLYNPLAKKKNQTLKFTNQVDSGVKVSQYFSLKLLQITGNLISNAVKFTPENGILEVSITQDSNEHERILNIIVKDSGKSMSADQAAAFNNGGSVARSCGTHGEPSFGLGLKHVKQLVLEEGGTISVKATKNKGTQFSISLPI